MPIYLFQHPDTEEVIEVVQGMNEKHAFTDNKGVVWERVWLAPQAVVDGKINCWSSQKFSEKIGETKGSMGDVYSRSAELSAQRASEAGGIDPVKTKFFDDYSNTRKGKRHPQDPRPATRNTRLLERS